MEEDIPGDGAQPTMFLRTGRLDIDFGVVSYPLPHTGLLGGWCFGGRAEEGGVKLGVEAEGVKGQRVPSRVERHGDYSGTDSGEMRAILPTPLREQSFKMSRRALGFLQDRATVCLLFCL